MKLGIGLGVNIKSSLLGGGGGAPDVELISHWIGDNISTLTIPNEVIGKPDLVCDGQNNTLFIDNKIAWLQSGTIGGAIATGTISNVVQNYSVIMAHHNADHSASINQRWLSAIDSGTTEIIDNIALNKDDVAVSFWNRVDGHVDTELPRAAIGSDNTNYVFTTIFEDPDIKIYRNGVLQGTLSGGFSAGKLDNLFVFYQYHGGGGNGWSAAACAEAKIFAGAIGDTQRIAEENALATAYGITF